jgi:CDP-glucose 4,6-dehydratase
MQLLGEFGMNNGRRVDANFWFGKRVFLTGHTGFKGSWLTYWLHLMGAHICGYALAPNTNPSIFSVLRIDELTDDSYIADIRDLPKLQRAILEFSPDIVIHMAAQPLVQHSYKYPLETYEVNIMGTANLLEAIRSILSIKATIIVTTDKCYENQGYIRGYREDDPMGGYDPYSSSKGCAELVISAYRRSFFNSKDSCNSIASARAGNVIGGGDWAEDRLIPDAVRAYGSKEELTIRNPLAIRPWQHVLEPLSGYLVLGQALYDCGEKFASGWNFGPNDFDARSVQEVIELFSKWWASGIYWHQDSGSRPHEAKVLNLDCTKAKEVLGWYPRWNLEKALEKTAGWYEAFLSKKEMREYTKQQINSYQYRGLK